MHGSLFSYCVQRLGMSEDEACRRIELARLARKFPALFPELASGAIGLSVALLLKPVLSNDNQRIQFAADAELKRKLELARDLLRHAHPGGDFAPVVSRALDLLLDELARQRFGARKQQSRRAHAAPGAETARTAALAPDAAPPPSVASPTDAASSPPSALFALDVASAPPVTPPAPNASAAGVSLPEPPSAAALPAQPAAPRPARARVSRGSRRAVSERDGLGCSWTDAAGTRCGSTAWLELDHREPAARHGSSQPENLRWLCRAHNQWAAEHAYGRAHIERAIRARRNSRANPRGGADPAPG